MARCLSIACACLVIAACTRPAEERARQDEAVGRANGDGLQVAVADGLAVVRELEDGRLRLWGSAPVFEFDVTASQPRELRLELWNALPDAELTGSDAAVTPEPDDSAPTRQSFRVELPSGTTRMRVAPPDADRQTPFTFAVLSDVQEAIDDVQDIYARINAEPDVRFLLGAGDLTENGTDEQLGRFESELRELDVPYFTTLGNHELDDEQTWFHNWYGRGSSQFLFQGVAFTLLDSASASLDPIVYDWLDAWLTNAQDRVHVVAMHIPPLDPSGVRNGAFASRAEAAKLLARLATGGVDLTLYGHVHSFYEFDNAGIPAYISGGGGAIPERFDRIGRHFLVVDADAKRGISEVRAVRVD